MQAQVPASGLPFPTAPEVIFTNWREVLHCSGLTPGMQAVYTMAMSGYLEYCSRNAVSVTKASAQAYMGDVIRRGLAKPPQVWKDGLNWFFREGHRHCGSTPRLADRALPTLGQADTGAQPWERRLIERLRIQHYAWRTEKTYREWAWRLAGFMRPRDLESATGEDLKCFLSDLAVRGRVSVATQKQGLNALIFLFREGLGREAGDLTGFQLSRRGPRVPTVEGSVNEIVIFPGGIGLWLPQQGRFRAAGAATPSALGCPCSSARRSRPKASWSWSAIPGLTEPSPAHPCAALSGRPRPIAAA